MPDGRVFQEDIHSEEKSIISREEAFVIDTKPDTQVRISYIFKRIMIVLHH